MSNPSGAERKHNWGKMDQDRDIGQKAAGLGADLMAALALFTRLPLPFGTTKAPRSGDAAWAWPLVSVVTGTLAMAVAGLGHMAALGAGTIAGLVILTEVMATGAMHEDGLADSADGLWGGWDKARRLEIMKDSHIGTYGVLALMIAVLLRWSALRGIVVTGGLWPALIVAGMAGRAGMVAVMAALPNARQSGLSQSVGQPTRRAAAAAALVAALAAIVIYGPAGANVIFAVVATTLAAALIARAKIGGQTGDICGATQMLGMVAALSVIATL